MTAKTSVNQVKIKIDNRRPERFENLVEYGRRDQAVDKTQDTDAARHFEAGDSVHYLRFEDHTDYYRRGRWKTGADGSPALHVWSLTDKPDWIDE